jgi:magnesium transporter
MPRPAGTNTCKGATVVSDDIRITAFSPETKPQPAVLDDLPGLLADPARVLWVDLTGPSEAGVALMRDTFHFHPLAIEDTFNQRQRPKLESYQDQLFMILNTLAVQEDEVRTEEVDAFVGDHYLVTVHKADEPVIDEFQERLTRAQPRLYQSANHLLYVLIDVVVDRYFPVIDRFEEEIEDLGDRILIAPHQADLNRLFQLKQDLIDLWRVTWPQRDVLNRLGHYNPAFMEERDLQYYMRDVTDHLMWIADMVNTLRDTLTSTMDLYMSAVSNRLNVVVNRLTIFAVIMGLVTVFSGFYGMNFQHTWPPFDAPWGIPLLIGVMVVVVAGMLVYFKRRGMY